MSALTIGEAFNSGDLITDQGIFEMLAQIQLRVGKPKSRAEAARFDTLLRRKGYPMTPLPYRENWYRDLPAGDVDVLQVFGESHA